MVGVLEGVGTGLVDGDRPGIGSGGRLLSGVDLEGVEVIGLWFQRSLVLPFSVSSSWFWSS